MLSTPTRDHRKISTWLFIGVFMVFVQILVGGITRLTGSGLSITRWEIVTGTIPPLNAAQWEESFTLYKQTPQYSQINEGMTLSHFKFIFFWEYIHRLWARAMGFVFAIPFFYFLLRKSLSRVLLKRLSIVVLLASLAAMFGWIMVASGLINRPWVNAYKLTVHLGLGVSLFVYLFFTWLSHRGYEKLHQNILVKNTLTVIIGMVVVQIIFGGLVSGMKASMNYPTWPLMNGQYIPSVLIQPSNWKSDNFLLYDKSVFMPALVQVIHRNLAYFICIVSLIFALKWKRNSDLSGQWIPFGLIGILSFQVGLGVLTLLHSVGSIPVWFGTLHQGLGILLLTFLIYIYLTIRRDI